MVTILFPPVTTWDEMPQRHQHLLKLCAKNGYEVIFCNRTKQGLSLKEDKELFHGLFSCQDISSLSKYLPKEYIYWTPVPYLLPFPHPPQAILYDCCDFFPSRIQTEANFWDKTDMVLASSRYLFKKINKLQLQHKKVLFLPNACPKEFADLPASSCFKESFILFCGAWGWWVDERAVVEASYTFPKKEIVIVGPLYGGKKISRPNVHFLGIKPFHELPNYYRECAFTIVPFKKHPTSYAADPLKIYESLTFGKRVVAMNILEHVKTPGVLSTFSRKEFIRKIAFQCSQQKCEIQGYQDYAALNTWEIRFQTLQNFLSDSLAKEME